MAVVLVTGGPGSPGISTTALALALTWPRDVVLADCDREPSQSVQAGYLRGADHGGRGLAALARAHREDRRLAPELRQHTVPLSESASPERRFLPGFSVPAAVRLFDPVWGELGDALATLDGHGVDVVVDAGTVGRDGLPLALLARTDLVCFVVRSSLRSLAGARLYLPLLADQLSRLPVDKPLGLLIVGPERPYSSGEIAAQFGVPCWGEIAWHERHADVLSEGDPEPARFWQGSFMSHFRALGTRLTERIAHERDLQHQLTAWPAHA